MHSIVDVEANSEVSESDVRFIVTHHDFKVEIRRIVNHEITTIPLATSGGVISTITWEVTVIMH